MTARPSDSTSASPLEHHPSASKSLQDAKASASLKTDAAAQATALIHATAALPQTPNPRPLQQPSGVQSPYPRTAAV